MMITLTIKALNGTMFDIAFDPSYSMDELYRAVWRVIPKDLQPHDISQLMLFRTGEKEEEGWIRPVRYFIRRLPPPSPLQDGECLALFFESIAYTVQLRNQPFNDMTAKQIIVIDQTTIGDINTRKLYNQITIYVNYDVQAFYYEDQLVQDIDPSIFRITGQDHYDLMDILQPLSLSPAAKECIYHQLYDLFSDVLFFRQDLVPDTPIYNYIYTEEMEEPCDS